MFAVNTVNVRHADETIYTLLLHHKCSFYYPYDFGVISKFHALPSTTVEMPTLFGQFLNITLLVNNFYMMLILCYSIIQYVNVQKDTVGLYNINQIYLKL